MAAFALVAGLEYRYSASSVNTAVDNGSVLRLEGERLALHLVRWC
jgi:hypothetical protein